MSFILGITEGSIVAIGLAVFALIISFVGSFLIMKTKTDKGDILIEVDKKIDDKLIPIVSRLEKHEESINDIKIRQEVIHEKVDNILTGQERLMNFMIKISDKLDTKKDK